MLFPLDITRGCIVNVRKDLLHPYQDPSFAKERRWCGDKWFFISMGHMFTMENKSSKQGG
jgi:hypothetical protein